MAAVYIESASEIDSSIGVDLSNFPQTNWVKAISDNGKAFYYDSMTKESTWKIPAVFVQWKSVELHRYKWKEMKNKDEGTMKKYPVYYYNRESKVTKWDKPAELLEFERRLDEVTSNQLLKKKKRRVETEERVSVENTVEATAEVQKSQTLAVEAPSEEERDFLLNLLLQTDFVLEDSADEIMTKLIETHKQDRKSIVSRLTGSYTGLPRMAQDVAEWIFLADCMSSAHTDEEVNAAVNSPITSIEHDTFIEDVISSHLNALARKSFDKTLADELITHTTKPPSWLYNMMDDSTWRRLLLELLDAEKGYSPLLYFCLRHISKSGYHREILQIVRESQYFEVFNELIISTLASIITTNDSEMYGVVEDLCRNCKHSDYMFLFSREVLRSLEKRIDEEMKGTCSGQPDDLELRKRKADPNGIWYSKIKRLRQELEKAVLVNSYSDVEINAEAPQALDKNAAFALRFTQLYDPAFQKDSIVTEFVREIVDIAKSGNVESVHVQRMYSILTGSDLSVADRESLISNLAIPKLETLIDGCEDPCSPIILARSRMIFESLIAALIHPKRMLNDPNAKTAILLALISIIQPRSKRSVDLQRDDIQATANALLKCRKYCVDILQQSHASIKSSDIPSKLCAILDFPIVAATCLKWISTYLVVNTRENLENFSLLQVFLQIIQEVSEKHTLQREDCFELLKDMIIKSQSRATDLSVASKEVCDCIDCLLFLMSTGFVMTPMNYFLEVSRKLGGPVMSYVISSLFDLIRPPLSHDFFVALKHLLNQTDEQCNFERLGEHKFEILRQKIEEIKHAASSSEVTLIGIVLKLEIPDTLSSDFPVSCTKDKEDVATELFGNDSP